MKRICIVLPDHWAANFGGAEYQAKVLIDALAAHGGFEITYLARNVSSTFVPAGYEIRRIKTCQKLARYGDFFDLPGLYSLLWRIRPDVIYQTVGCAYTGACALYARRAGIKMVWQIASDIDVQPLAPRWTRNYPFRFVEKKLLEYGVRHATVVIAQTKVQAESLLRHYGRRANAIVPNFHPLPTEQISKGDDRRVVWIANLKPLKRPELFIRLARELREKGVRATFTMIGRGGDSEWHRRILDEIARDRCIEYLGELSQDEVNRVLAQAHVLVNTSEYEGFPNTFIQAWMRGVPVVSISVNPDGVLCDQRIGLASGTYERCRDDVHLLLVDDGVRAQMGERARLFALQNYSIANADKLIAILKE